MCDTQLYQKQLAQGLCQWQCPFLSAQHLGGYLKYRGQFWAPHYNKDVGKVEQEQLGAAKTITGCTRRGEEGWVWTAFRKSSNWRSYCSLQLPHRRAEKTEPDSSLLAQG